MPDIVVLSGGFSPAARTVPTVGSKVTWQGGGGATASVTSNGGLPLLKSLVRSSGTYSFTFWSAGSFPYHSLANPSQKGVIQVKMCNVPKTAHVNTATTFRVASAHRRGWVADVEVLRPGTTKWAWLKTDVTTALVHPGAGGHVPAPHAAPRQGDQEGVRLLAGRYNPGQLAPPRRRSRSW
jgi:hypothetical protein